MYNCLVSEFLILFYKSALVFKEHNDGRKLKRLNTIIMININYSKIFLPFCASILKE